LERITVQAKAIISPPKGTVTTKWEFSKSDFGTPHTKSFEKDVILSYTGHIEKYIDLDEIYKILSPRTQQKIAGIPSDMLPEVVAVSTTGVLSIAGLVVSLLFFASSSTLFLAPLLASVPALLFLWGRIKQRS
jgi:hypothetical protein